MVGTVIGSGIFLVPRTMIEKVGTVEAVFAVWVVGGCFSLAGALSYAELAAALPEAGGEYAFLREAYGPLWGFLYSWTQMWVAKSGSIATLATGFFLYLTTFFEPLKGVIYTVPLPIGPNGGPLEIQYGQLFAIALILSLAWLNYYGVKIGGNVQVAVTFLETRINSQAVVRESTRQGSRPEASVTSLTFSGFIAALVAALWAYDGWNNVSMVSSEIKAPQKNLPRALIGGTLCVIAIYMLANAAYFHVLKSSEVAGSTRVAAEMMRKIFQAPGAAAVSIAAMISIFAALNGSILSGARVPYAAARDGYFFHAIGRVHPRHHTPGSIHPGIELLGVSFSTFRKIRRFIQSGYFRQLDFVRHDRGGGSGTSVQAAKPAPSVPHNRLPGGPDPVRGRSWNPLVFNSYGAPAGVRNRSRPDGPGASFLLLLEGAAAPRHDPVLQYVLATPVL